MQPTLRQFEVFLAVAKAASFRAAAEAMHLSQPALSQHVAEMERELGARLFDRLGRRVALTEAGRILEEHALRLFASLASAREAVADLSELKRGSLVIGASTTPGIYVLPRIIAAFQESYPRVTLSLRIDNSALIEERIRRNEVDLGVVGGHIHAFMELGHTEAIKQAVMAGLGVAFVSRHAIRGEVATGLLHALRLRGLRIRRHFHIIHNEARTLSASARAFIELLRSARG